MTIILNGDTGITTPTDTVTGSTSPTNGIYLPTTNAVGFSTNSTERMRIDSSGNVGIGTSSPAYKLEVNGAVGVTALAAVGSAGTATLDSSGARLSFSRASANYISATTAGGYLAFGSDGTESQMVLSGGKLGIGTSSPNAKLGILQSSNASGAIYAVSASGQNGNAFLFGISGVSNGYAITNDGSNNIAHIWCGTSGAERMRIDSSGNVLIGTTSATALLSSKFQVVGTGSYAASIQTQNSSTAAIAFTNVSGTATYLPAYFFNNGTSFSACGYISVSGSSTAYVTTSDYRLKENVTPMTGALAVVQRLNPVTYTWKADGSNGQGFIAHELQEVVPDCVTGEKDAVDENGKIKPQGVDTSFLVATLTAAIQELNAKVESLEAQLKGN